MKTKKILSMALAAVMTMSLAIPAFAADSGDDEPSGPKNTVVISGGYQEANIAVTVPGEVQAFLNPYGLGTSVTKSDDSKVDVTGQIVTIPQAITNESGLTLNVGATVTGEIPLAEGVTSTNAMKFATTTTKGVGTNPDAEGYVAPATTKSAYVNLQVVQAPATVVGDSAAEIADPIIEASVKDATWTSASSVNVGTKAVTAENLAVLKAASLDSEGAFSAYAAGSVVLFRLTGDCVVSPKIAWAETDTFKVTVAFTFTPAAA